MGEAKRRKAAGSDHGAVAVEDFTGPDGMLTLTIDCEGAPPTSVMFDPSMVVDTMAAVSQFVADAKLPYYPMVRGCYTRFVAARQRGDETADEEITSLAVSVLWTCLHHPRQGETLRRHVSQQLRLKGKTHITWRCGPDGLAVGLGDAFLDLEAAAAGARAAGAEQVFYHRKPGRKDDLH